MTKIKVLALNLIIIITISFSSEKNINRYQRRANYNGPFIDDREEENLSNFVIAKTLGSHNFILPLELLDYPDEKENAGTKYYESDTSLPSLIFDYANTVQKNIILFGNTIWSENKREDPNCPLIDCGCEVKVQPIITGGFPRDLENKTYSNCNGRSQCKEYIKETFSVITPERKITGTYHLNDTMLVKAIINGPWKIERYKIVKGCICNVPLRHNKHKNPLCN